MGCLQFHIRTTYDRLVSKLGPPTDGPDDYGGDKTTCEWYVDRDGKTLRNIETSDMDKVLFSVYDWKEERTPRGQYCWHIGGHFEDVDAIRKMIKDKGLELPFEEGEFHFKLAKFSNGHLTVERWTSASGTTSEALGKVARSWTSDELYSIFEAHGHPKEMYKDESVSAEELFVAAQVLSSACFVPAPSLKRKRSE